MKKLLLLLSLFTACLYSSAQTSHIFFDHYNIKEGLPESYVNGLIEDSQGYIWMGTQNGLVKYDGYNYKIYALGDAKTNTFSTTSVISIIEDAQKTIWITTVANGLYKYDRHIDTFIRYAYPQQKISLVYIAEITDKAGNIWGDFVDAKTTIAKLNVANGKFQYIYRPGKGKAVIETTSNHPIAKDPDGSIWIGGTTGLYKYNEGKPLKEFMHDSDTAKQRRIETIYVAPSQPGVVWVCTSNKGKNARLTKFDSHTGLQQDYKHSAADPYSIKNDTIPSIYEDRKKQLWFTTMQGLSKLDKATGKFINYELNDTLKSHYKNTFSEFTETKDGKLWLNSGVGLVFFDPVTNVFNRYIYNESDDGSLSNNNPYIKIIDHTGVLWSGNAWGGTNRVDKIKSAFIIYKKNTANPKGFRGNTVTFDSFDDKSTLLTDSLAIYKWVPGTSLFDKLYTRDKGAAYRSNAIKGKDGLLYVGSGKGLFVYNTTTGQKQQYSFNAKDTTSISSNAINTLLQDHTGIIWIGTSKRGVCSFNPVTKKFTRYPYREFSNAITEKNKYALDDAQVISIYEDRENNLWIGTNNGALNLFNRQTHNFTSTVLNKKNNLLYCVVNMYEDKNGRFWIGTYLNGLFEFDRKTGTCIRNLTQQSGLLMDATNGINEDDAGRLWVLSDRGLSRINTRTMAIKNFSMPNILPGYKLSHSAISDVYKLKNGHFLIGLDNAIAEFDPKDLDDNPNPPVVHIEDMFFSNPRGDGKKVDHVIAYGHSNLDVAYNQNRIQFNYIGLHYDDPQNNTYAYKLDGYDKQWVQAGTNRSVTYTNLPTGTYTFRVKAANSSGVWDNTGDSITIVIHPPWWYTWWMRLLYLALFVWAIYAFIKYRSRKLKRANELLEEKIHLRTSQLSEANKELSEQQEEITAQRDQLSETVNELKTTQQQLVQSEKLASLGELTAGIAHEIQNPLNFVNNFSEVSMELAVEMKEELQNGNAKEASALADDIEQNLEKIIHHGKRADAIVKNMLQHSRNNSGEKQPTDINALADEYFRLSYHGLRAKDKSFNSEMVSEFDKALPKLDIIPQDIGRVLLNLYNNAFYAVQQRKKTEGGSFKPEVKVSTLLKGNFVEIKVADNGIGIPDSVKEKIMQPFFTTKPTGEGTGLGLSLSYDIVVKGHNGKIDINSKEGEGSEFTISIPLNN